MELLPVIGMFIAAYAVFLFVAYVLARIFFPTLDLHHETKSKRVRTRDLKRLASR